MQFLTDIGAGIGTEKKFLTGTGTRTEKNFDRDRDWDQNIFTGTRPTPGPKKSDFADPYFTDP
jgi:hypothetical protein